LLADVGDNAAHSRRGTAMRRTVIWGVTSLAILLLAALPRMAWAAERAPDAPLKIDIPQLFRDGGAIGYVICGLSLAMVALIVEHMITIRRGALMPGGLAEEVHRLLVQGQFLAAAETCRQRPSFLGHMLQAGLGEVDLGYAAVEKAMEDAAVQQSARLSRKIETLSLISTVAPMLGLMGTVWGMILAFMEFERKANPQVSELAPGVYKALVTTLFGLIVAVPAIAAFAYFRNRIDELVAQTALLAEHVFADFKRAVAARRRAQRQAQRTAVPKSATRPAPKKEPPA
jgi:biopolymer transport protein ExbB